MSRVTAVLVTVNVDAEPHENEAGEVAVSLNLLDRGGREVTFTAAQPDVLAETALRLLEARAVLIRARKDAAATPDFHEERARARKAADLVSVAGLAGASAADIGDPEVRTKLLGVLAIRRGVPTISASERTWGLVTDRMRQQDDADRRGLPVASPSVLDDSRRTIR